MQILNNVYEAIGQTPLVRLNTLASDSLANIYAKLEFLNPAGSVKDRMARFIVEDAERRGLLKPGGTIVENSSGNTGSALAMIAAVKGYRCIITMPDKMSQEKQDLMRAFGAEVIVTPTDVPADSPQSYYSTARRLAEEIPGAFYPDQYNNPVNIEAHYRTTGPEIWEQTGGNFDLFVAGIGTGGTLSGVGRYLKDKNPKIKVVAIDPKGSVFYHYFKTGKLPEPQVYKVEGIGEDYLVKAVDFSIIDDMFQVNDQQSFVTARRLARQEGIFAGGSSGSAVWGALQAAQKYPEIENIIVILPDSGTRYLSKIYNEDWMAAQGYLDEDDTAAMASSAMKDV